MPSFSRLSVIFAAASLLVIGAINPVYAKRGAPPIVAPLVVGETEYRVAHEKVSAAGKPAGLQAFVVAHDAKTQKDLWKAEIYTITYKPDLETDVQDVFIKTLAADGKRLVVTNENGAVFHVDPATQKVTPAK